MVDTHYMNSCLPACCSVWVVRLSMAVTWPLPLVCFLWRGRAPLLSELGGQLVRAWKSKGLDFFSSTGQKAEKNGVSCCLCLGYQPIPGLGLLVIDLDVNKVGSLMHRLTKTHRFLVRWDLHGTGQNFFLYLGSLVPGLPSVSPRSTEATAAGFS